MVHHAAAGVRVFLDHLARDGSQARVVESRQKRVVGFDELDPQGVAVDRPQSWNFGVEVEAARSLGLHNCGIEPHNFTFEIRRIR